MSTGNSPTTNPPTEPTDSDDGTTDGSTDPTDGPADAPADGPTADSAVEGSDASPAEGPGEASTDAPADESTEATADGSTDPAGNSSPDDSASSDSTEDEGSGCAEIPCAAHAVLTAAVKLAVRIPHSPEEASQLPHKLTLSNDDGSYTKTLALASDCQPGGPDGTSMVTFEDMTEHHTYTLQCDNGDTSYPLFKDLTYEQVLKFGTQDDAGSATSDPPSTGAPGAQDSTDAGAS